MKKDEDLGNVKVKGSLSFSKHDTLQFNILKEVSKGNTGIMALEFRIYFSLLRNVLYGIDPTEYCPAEDGSSNRVPKRNTWTWPRNTVMELGKPKLRGN